MTPTLTYNRFLKFNQPNSSQYQNFDKLCAEKISLITNPCCAARLKGKINKKNKFSNHLLSIITTRGKACLRLVLESCLFFPLYESCISSAKYVLYYFVYLWYLEQMASQVWNWLFCANYARSKNWRRELCRTQSINRKKLYCS